MLALLKNHWLWTSSLVLPEQLLLDGSCIENVITTCRQEKGNEIEID